MGIVGFVILMVFVGLGSVLTKFIDIPSALIIVVLCIALLSFSFGTQIAKAIKTVFNRHADKESLMLGVAFFDRARSYIVVCGVLGTLIGQMIMGIHMDDPAIMGPGLALSLLTQAYALLIAFGVVLPISSSLQRRLDALEG